MLQSPYIFYKFISVLVRYLPRKVSNFAASLVGSCYWLGSKKERLAVQKNLSQILALPERKCFFKSRLVSVHFAKYLTDFFLFPCINRDKFVKLVSLSPFDQEKVKTIYTQKKGIIVLTAHLGHWELGVAVMSFWGFPLNVIYLPHKDERINRLFLQNRSPQIRWIPVGKALSRGLRLLKQGEILATAGDLTFGEAGLKIDFLGKPAFFPSGPALLSVRTGAPILPAFIVRENQNQYREIVEEPIWPLKDRDRKDEIHRITKEFVKILEKYIRQYPEQWYIFQKFWP